MILIFHDEVKYTKEGSIFVEAREFQTSEPSSEPSTTTLIEIVIADTGCGIENSRLQRMFHELEQVEYVNPAVEGEDQPQLGELEYS